MGKVRKYVVPDAEGRKLYVVGVWDFGRTSEALAWADGAPCARRQVINGRTNYRYDTGVRRATPADVERVGMPS